MRQGKRPGKSPLRCQRYFRWTEFTIAATITAKFLADIVAKANQFFSGLQIQSPITVGQIQSTPVKSSATNKPGDAVPTSASETTSTVQVTQ